MTDPVRILFTADLHGGLTRYGQATATGNTRLDDFEALLDRIATIGVEYDAVLFGGDTFDSRREGPRERAAFTRCIGRLTPAGTAVLVVEGNHDGKTTVGDPSSSALRWLRELRLPGVHLFLMPTSGTRILVRGKRLDVAALPYPHKRSFDVELADMDPEDRVIEAGKRLERVIRQWGESPAEVWGGRDGVPHIFVGHMTVGLAKAGAEVSMKFSWDVAVPAEAFEQWDATLLGHIHRQQSMLGGKVWYAGSPAYLDFSEVDQPKGFLDVTVERGKAPIVKVVDAEPRPMVVVPIQTPESGDYRYDSTLIKPGAIVKAVAAPTGRPNMASLNALVASMRHEGASFVKLEVVRQQAPAEQRIAVDPTVDVLTATERYLTANGHPLEPTMAAARQLVQRRATA